MARIRINGVEHSAELGNLTWGEVDQIEEVTGQSFDQWAAACEQGRVRAVKCFYWLLLRRSDPTVTIADVDKLPVNAVEIIPDEKPEHAGRVTKGKKATKPTQAA